MLKQRINVLIADDTDIALEGLQSIFATTNDIKTVGAAGSIHELPRMVKELSPDIVIVDLKWHGDESAGWLKIREIKDSYPDVKIMALTAFESLMDDAWRANADVVISKNYTREEIIALVRKLYAGDIKAPRSFRAAERLTEREIDVIKLLAKGLSNLEISETLQISPNTAKNHVKNIREKLDAENRAKAVIKAKEYGII